MSRSCMINLIFFLLALFFPIIKRIAIRTNFVQKITYSQPLGLWDAKEIIEIGTNLVQKITYSQPSGLWDAKEREDNSG
jgi:hypothetical protein